MLWEDKWVRVNQFFICKLAYTSIKQTELKHANSLSMKFSSPLLLKQGILETTPNLCFDELLYWSNSWQTLSSRPSAHHLQSIWQVNPHWGAQPGRSYWFFYLYSDLDDARGRHQKKIRSKTQNYLNLYAVEGLRTLCIAKRVSVRGETHLPVRRAHMGNGSSHAQHPVQHSAVCPPQVLSKEEYACWLQSHIEAEASVEGREELLFQSAVRLETNLCLLGN